MLPESVSTCRIQGTYVGFDGEPARGEVHFYPTVDEVYAGGVAILRKRSPLTAKLVNGVLDLTVPATDDPDVTPSGWGYRVVEHFDNRADNPAYTVLAPASGVNLPTAVPAAPVQQLAGYVRTVNGGTPDSAGNVTVSLDGDFATSEELTALDSRVGANENAVFNLGVSKANAADLASVATTGAYGDLAGTPDLSGYAVAADVATALAGKQPVGDYATNTALSGKVAKGELTINARDYGVVGDGVTNDQPSLGTAYNAVPTGGVLYIPAGTYLLNTRLIVSKSVTIQGAGKGATTLLIAGAAFQVGASGVTVRDLTIRGSAGVQTRLALQSVTTAGNYTDWTFQNVRFDGVGLNPTRIGSIDANGATVTSGADLASNVNVIGCEFVNYKADAVLHINGTHNVLVQSCWFHDSGLDINAGDNIKVKSSATGTRIMHNLIERSARDGIDCYDSKQNTIIGNVIRDVGVHGIEMKFTSTGSPNDRHIVMGNRIINPGLSTPAPGMQLAVDHVTVLGNVVEGGSNYGFRCGAATDLSTRHAKGAVFIGNQAIGNASHGFIFNGVDDSVVVGNVALGNGGDGYNILSTVNTGIRMDNNVATGNTGTQYNGPSAPATATSAGSPGQVIYDSSFMYVCTAPNVWRRTAIASW